MKNKLLIILVVVMLFTNFVYADEMAEVTEIEMEKHIVEWGVGVEIIDGEKELIILKNTEEIEKSKKHTYIFDSSKINIEIPKDFYLGQAGLISANTHLNGFIKITNNNTDDIKIENAMRLFEREELEGKKHFFDNNELINYGDIYRFTDFIDTTGEEIFFETYSGERQYGKTIDGYFLLIPQKIGNFSLTIEVGENGEVYDKKEIEFEVKEPQKGVNYTYKINPELSQEILIRLRDTWKSEIKQQTVCFSDSVTLGKINEEFYLEINKSENVKSDYIGRIELKDEENYVIFDESKRRGDFFAISRVEMNPQEKSEVSIMLTHPAWFHIRGGMVEGVELTGRPHSNCCIGVDMAVSLYPKINFKNVTTPPKTKNDKEKFTGTPTTSPKNNSKTPIVLITFGVGISVIPLLILLDRKKLRISLMKNEENLISVIREGGRKEFVNTKISFLIENEKELIEKDVEMELATGEIRNINKIMEEIKTDNEQILGIKVVTENDKNYSDDIIVYLINGAENEN